MIGGGTAEPVEGTWKQFRGLVVVAPSDRLEERKLISGAEHEPPQRGGAPGPAIP